jgi:hypothetical protein
VAEGINSNEINLLRRNYCEEDNCWRSIQKPR